jgi:hypothetical protein
MGTPGYMSPEQVSGGEVDARSDQWSFCAALYEALYGVLPFHGETFEQFAGSVLSGKLPTQLPAPLGGVEVPVVVEQALRRGLARDPAARFESMNALSTMLETALLPDADSVASQRLKWSTIIAVPVLLVLLIFLFHELVARHNQPPATLRLRGALLAWLVLVAYLLNLVRARALVVRQPAFRRLVYLPVLICGYVAVGRTVGALCGVTTADYLILEPIGIIALLFSQLPHGRHNVYPVVVCVASIVLVVLRPEYRWFYAYANYISVAILVVYAHLQASRSSAAAKRA